MNVYHTPQYQAYRQECAFVFDEMYCSPRPGQTEALSEGWSVYTAYYLGQRRYQIRAARHQLLDSGGQVIYIWDNINDDGEFYQLIAHSNGNHYLIFREDLYGYSVLEVESGKTLHYMPEESWPLDGGQGKETFIWTSAAYDRRSNLLAVSGCYWASTNDTLFLDFSHPLEEQGCGRWLEMHNVMDPDYDLYDDIDLERFGGDGRLYFKTFSAEDGARGEFTFSVDRLLSLVRENKLKDKERG